ncbi:sulfurtransferase [Caenispirillum salinarum]|uniref:sulfurtransferase n=1 Tax=Caenispirillum salinarum TaxID=859058 RepID=UPI000A076738|nr:rhodanese-like domain-containing protein [Caenispirillum salinarum]
MTRRILAAAALAATAILAAPPAVAEVPGPLVAPAWLAEQPEGSVVVLDVREEPGAFGKSPGRIAGALPVSFKDLRGSRTIDGQEVTRLSLTAEGFQDLMRGRGVDDGETVVVTWPGDSAIGLTAAAYLYWQARLYGHDDVAILDGGTAAWAASGRALTQDAPADPQPGTFTAAAARDDLLATTEEVQAALDGGPQLIDARPLALYIGLAAPPYVFKKGHIPGADLLPFPFLTKPVGGKGDKGDAAAEPVRMVVHEPETLRRIAADLGVDLSGGAISYCNSGRTSASTWFVLNEVLGVPTQLYDGSMHAWTLDPQRPVATALAE